jgi:hypothetical protein
MSKDSKKIILVGILITIILGFLIIWILVEDHKSPAKSGYKNTHASGSEQLNYQKPIMANYLGILEI